MGCRFIINMSKFLTIELTICVDLYIKGHPEN